MSISTWISEFVHDLLQPKRIDRVVPPRPPTDEEMARYLFRQAILAEVLSGEDSTYADKAMFVLGPLAVNAAATWGAQQGAQLHRQQAAGLNSGLGES